MKFNFAVDVDESDNGYDLQEEILDRATKSFIQQTMGHSWEDDSMSHELKKKIEDKIDEICNKDFKDAVAQKVIDGLTSKVEKSKQYKELLKGQEIESDAVIKTGLKDIVSDVVKSEMKKMFTCSKT